MQPLPEEFLSAWAEREPLAAFATQGTVPNVIWVLCMHLDAEAARLIIADNAMDKTRANIDAGSSGSLVMLAQPRRAYQLRGTLTYHDSGEVFEQMKHGWLADTYPGRGAVAMTIGEIFAGPECCWSRDG